jgi:hypothetical protein
VIFQVVHTKSPYTALTKMVQIVPTPAAKLADLSPGAPTTAQKFASKPKLNRLWCFLFYLE